MASSNTANWPVYSRKRKANVEELSWWFQGPKYLQFALRATRTHLTPTSYQQSRQLFIRHKLARQSKIRELLSGKKKKKPKKQQLREERRPLIDRDALHSVCQLQTPDGRNRRSSWLQELLQVQVCSCFSTREFWDGPQECSTSMGTEWWETVFNLFNLLQTGGDSDLFLKSCLWNNRALTLEDESMPSEWAHIYSTLFCDMIEAAGGLVTYLLKCIFVLDYLNIIKAVYLVAVVSVGPAYWIWCHLVVRMQNP